MAKIYDNSITRELSTKIILDSLQKEELCFFLGETDTNYVKSENTQQSRSDVSSLGYVESIQPGEIKLVSPVPDGSHSNWRTGTNFKPGYYSNSNLGSLTSKNAQPYWIVKSNSGPDLIALVVGFSGVKNNKSEIDGMGSPQYTLGAESVSGSVETNSDGIDYCIIGALPDGPESFVSNKYIPLEDSVMIDRNLNRYSGTSVRGEASSICGPGEEKRCGTCCLYHKTGGYDSIADETFKAGDLYKCLETKCYECVEIARGLDKEYIFNKWKNGVGATTGTGGRCYECNDFDTTHECGSCACTIDYNERSLYENIINNNNIPITSSADTTARLTQYGEDNLSGAVSSALISLPKDKEKRKMAADYVDRPDLWVLPLEGDGEKLAEIRVATETDGTNVWITGLEKPTHHGYKYSHIRVREDDWKEMFPYLSVDDIEVNLFPIGGPAKMIASILPTAVMVKKTIQKTNIKETTDQTTFNRYGICKLFEEGVNKVNALSGKASGQKIKLNPSIKIEFQATDGSEIVASQTFTEVSADVSKDSGGGKGGFGGGFSEEAEDTTTSVSSQSFYSDKIISSSLRQVNPTTVSADVQTKSLTAYETGTKLAGKDGTNYTVSSVTKPTSVSGQNIDPYKTEILTRNVSVIDLDKQQQDSLSITFEMLFT